MKYIILLSLLVLSGCATSIPKIEIQRVEIPVLKTCHEGKLKPVKPILLTDSYKGDTSLDKWLNGALKDINELKLYSEQLNIFICE